MGGLFFSKVRSMNLGLFPRWQRWALFFLLGLALLWALAWAFMGAVLPRWVHGQIEKQGLQRLGRVVTVEQVVFQPGSLHLHVRGLRVGKAGAQAPLTEPQLRVDEIEVDAALKSLWLWAPVADAMALRGVQLNLTHLGQGRFDTDDVMQRLSDQPQSPSGFPRMALSNIQIRGGGVQLRDAAQSLSHAVTDLQLDLPFLSNIGNAPAQMTQPQLSFKLNGVGFEAQAQAMPFAADRKSQARLQVKGLNLAPYLPYLPATWPVRLLQGQLQADLKFDFESQKTAQWEVSGHVALAGLKLDEKTEDSTSLPLLSLGAMEVKLDSWRPLEGRLEIGHLLFKQAEVHLRRDRAGLLNLVRLQGFFLPPNPPSPAPQAGAALYAVKRLNLSQGQVHWDDASTPVPVTLQLSDIALQSDAWQWPAAQTATFNGQAKLGSAKLSWRGQTDLKNAQLQLQLQDLPLQPLAPYWAGHFVAPLTGLASAEVDLDWRAPQGQKPSHWRLLAPQVHLAQLAVGTPGDPELSWANLALEQLEVDGLARQVRLGRVALSSPSVKLSRSTDGRWMVQNWLPEVKPRSSEPSTKASPWRLAVQKVLIDKGQWALDDHAAPTRVQWKAQDIQLSAGPGSWPAQAQAMTPIQLDLRTGTARRSTRQLGFKGAFQLPGLQGAPDPALPLRLKGQLDVMRFPVHLFAPYGAHLLPVALKRADLSYAGSLDLSWPESGLALGMQGHASVNKLHLDALPGQALLEVEALSVKGLDLAVASGALTHLAFSESVFNDFFARVDIDPRGQLNWQKWLKPSPASGPTSALAAGPVLSLGPVALVNGRVSFSDHFIQPPYSAEVSDLAGTLGAFSNRSANDHKSGMAELNLRGRVAGSGTLEVTGRINPLSSPVTLTVQGRVSDLELPQLSTYSAKYTGYGIERGKLSAKVDYRIDGKGQLQATHQITLDQLVFGEPSGSQNAPNLPIKLAAALLADRDGVIQLQLPVSGSINDPDFSIAQIVWKLTLNLIGKAILSPFGLLSGIFSSDEQLQQIVFLPGSADLQAAALGKLDSVAKLLADKPTLRLTIEGQADLQTEREALRRAKLNDLLLDEKRRRASRSGPAAKGLTTGQDEAQEHAALIRAAYRRSSVPKPSNLLGAEKNLATADMEALLLASIAIDQTDMQALAQSRAQQVRDSLVTAKVPQAQLFLGAPVLSQPPPAQPFVPQVNLRLSTR